MGGVTVTCESCHQSFTLPVDPSPYLLFDLQSRPCPFCEAYTLSTRTDESDLPVRRSRVRRLRRLQPESGDSSLNAG